MPLETLTRSELVEFVKAQIRGFHGEADLAELSDYDIEARILSALYLGNQGQAEYVLRQLSPRTCDDDFLDTHAQARGTARLLAAKSTGKAIAGCSTAGRAVPLGTVLVAPDGTRFVTTTAKSSAASSFTGKAIGEASGLTRALVSPDVSGVSADDLVQLDGDYDGGASIFAIKAVLTGAPAVDCYRPFRVEMPAGEPFDAATGALLDIEAEEAGAAGNKPGWEVLSWESKPHADFDDEVIVAELGAGGDDESDDELRARLIAWDEGRPGQGNAGSYREWVFDVPDARVGRVFVFPNLVAMGVQTLVCEGVSGARVLPISALDAIEAYLDELRPPADIIDVRTRVYSATLNLSFAIRPAVGFEPDWGPTVEDGTPPASYTVDTGSTTTRVELTNDPTGVIEEGDRVLVTTVIGTRSKTVERTVGAVGSNYVDVTEALEVAPLAGSAVTPGGPLSTPILEALETFFDDLGPSVYVTSTVERLRVPATSTEGDDTVRLADLTALIMGVEGVENIALVSPASDQIAAALSTIRLGAVFMTFEAT